MVKYTCEKCESEFNSKLSYDRHMARVTDCTQDLNKKKVSSHECEFCERKFSRKDSMIRHLKTCTVKVNIRNTKNNKNKNSNNTNNNNNKNADNKNNNKNANNKNTNNKNTNNKHTINKNTINKNNNNKTVNIKGNNNKNINTKIIINNIQLPIGIDKSHLENLSFDDEIAIFNSNEHPMMMIINNTHLAQDKFEYHNVGYIDKHSGTGYVYNGKKFVQKPIKYILRNLFECRLKDLEELHDEMKELFNEETNECIKGKLEHMNKLLYGNPKDPKQSERYVRDLKNLNMTVKSMLYTHKKLFKEAYERTNKINGDDDSDDIPQVNPVENILKSGLSKEEAFNQRKNKIMIKNLKNLKKEMAKDLLKNIENNIAAKDYKILLDMISLETNTDTLNIINRLLSKSFCFNNKINSKIIEKELEKDALIEEIIGK